MNTVRLPSASGIWLAYLCPLSAALGGRRARTAQMEAGTVAHRALERAARLTNPAAPFTPDDASADLRAQLDHWWSWRWSAETVAWWPPTGPAEVEVGIAIDLERLTARRIPARHPETGYDEAGLVDGEIPCTADLIIPPGEEDGVAEVVDWKSSLELDLSVVEHEARWRRQVTVYAVAASLLYGGCDVRVRTVQVGPDGPREGEPVLVSAFELLGVAAELAELQEQAREQARRLAAGETPDARPGAHCASCPAAGHCPRAREAIEAVVIEATPANDSERPLIRLRAPESGRDVGELLTTIALARGFLDELETATRAWVAEQPGGVVELGDGRVAGYERVNGHRIVDMSVPGAVSLLGGIVGPDRVEAVAPRRTSIEAIERAVRARITHQPGVRLERGAIKRALDGALATLTAAGVIRTGGTPAPRWFCRASKATPEALIEQKLRASLVGGKS